MPGGGGGGGGPSGPDPTQVTLQNRQQAQLEQQQKNLALQRQQASAQMRAGSNLLGRALLLNTETGLPASTGAADAGPQRKLGG